MAQHNRECSNVSEDAVEFKSEAEIDKFGDDLGRAHGLKLQHPPAKWTGWKYCGYAYPTSDGIRRWDDGFVSQLVWYKLREDRTSECGYYVNLPGMQSGKFYPGGTFDIGDQRVTADTRPKEINQMIVRGWEQLVALVKEAEGIDIASCLIEMHIDEKAA